VRGPSCVAVGASVPSEAVRAEAGARRVLLWLLFLVATGLSNGISLVQAGPTGPAADGASSELGRVLDRLVETQRPHGGWTFPPEHPGGPPIAFTMVVRLASRLLGPLGLARWDLVVIRSPGTPLAGRVLLDGWRLEGDGRWLEAARRTGDLLVQLQRAPGGWLSEMPVEGSRLAWWFVWLAPRIHLDDDVTTGAIGFLLALSEATGELRYRRAAERGLALLLEAQLPSGAWPPVHRPAWLRAVRSSREDRASLNDGTTPLAIETLLAAWRVLGRSELLAAARRGGEWLIAAQGAAPQAGWAQQYDERGRPARMRRFELPALATWETRHAADALEALAEATGEERWCSAVREAGRWLATAAMRPGCWPRFVTVGTGQPLFVDATGEAVALEAARPGYDWTGDFGIPFLLWRLGLHDGPPPPQRPPGDPGSCPGVSQPLRAAGGPRALAADAAILVARRAGPRRSVCAQ